MVIHTDYFEEFVATADSDEIKDVLKTLTDDTDIVKICDNLVESFQAKLLEATTAYLNKTDRLPSAVKKLNIKLKNKTKKDFALEIKAIRVQKMQGRIHTRRSSFRGEQHPVYHL